MTQEAMKLALEALRQIDEAMPFPVAKLAQAALREALAEQPAQQEPVASISYIPCCTDQTCPKCKAAAPSQRTWVGLTDEEILSEAKRFALGLSFPFNGITTPEMFARTIEAKLRDKNSQHKEKNI